MIIPHKVFIGRFSNPSHGRWVNLDTERRGGRFLTAEDLHAIGREVGGEYGVFDHSGFGEYAPSEAPNFEQLIELVEAAAMLDAEHGPVHRFAFWSWVQRDDVRQGDLPGDRDKLFCAFLEALLTVGESLHGIARESHEGWLEALDLSEPDQQTLLNLTDWDEVRNQYELAHGVAELLLPTGERRVAVFSL